MLVATRTSNPPTRTYHDLRDNHWLLAEMEFLWEHYFPDVPRANNVEIEFTAPWKARLGVITMALDERTSYIGINALLRHLEVPTYITTITVAHEMVHYAHGFGSPLPRRYKYPHRGGIVQKELFNRGLRPDFDLYLDWIHRHWFGFYDRWVRDDNVFTLSGPLRTPAVNLRPGQSGADSTGS